MILIAAATLMTGASVYGLIDYNKRSGSKDFENLYRKDKATGPREAEKVNTPVVRESDSKTIGDKKVEMTTKAQEPVKKTPKKKRNVSYKEFSRAEPTEVIEEKDLR